MIMCEKMSVFELEREIKHVKYNIKIINHYLDNPSEIKELAYIHSYDELLNYKDELKNKLKNYRKLLRNILKEC